jgi:uncharacterized membrane protein YraQ (UPF0718 family)/copper chaperone CopZ
MMDIIGTFLGDLADIINEMSPYLMLGFLFAGILHVFFPRDRVHQYMGGNNKSSVINASLIGIPLPLCSCGVIPTGISFYRHGASKGSTVSFLISTPQTGIDSILVTYSLLGLPFALIRPVIALITGFMGGFITNRVENNRKPVSSSKPLPDSSSEESTPANNRFTEVFRYAFVEFLQDISKYLVIGLLIAAAISIAIPDDFFSSFIGNDFLSMLVILLAAIPVYVCATASVPIAAILMLKGLSPGAALVLLMAGPATNAATITMIHKILGFKSLLTYLLTIIAGALTFGTIINHLLPESWFSPLDIASHGMEHTHGILPEWLKIISSILLVLLIIHGYIRKMVVSGKITRQKASNYSTNNMEHMVSKKILVKGMTCNHCRQNVETKIKSFDGIEEVQVDLSTGRIVISGKHIDLDKIQSGIESIGYDYLGETP